VNLNNFHLALVAVVINLTFRKEFNHSRDGGVESVVGTAFYSLTGYEFSAPLPDDNLAGLNGLTIVFLNAQAF